MVFKKYKEQTYFYFQNPTPDHFYQFPNIFTTHQGPQPTVENATHFIHKDHGDLAQTLPFACVSHAGELTPEITALFLALNELQTW